MFLELSQIFQNPRRIKILKFFAYQPDVRLSAQAVSSVLGISKGESEKEARALVRFGMLHMKRQKGMTLFSINTLHPWLSVLQTFFEATTLPNDRVIAAAFKGIAGISLIIATGVLAQEERSSIDILIVARKTNNPHVARAVARLERLVGLPLRYVILEPSRYTERFEANDRLLRDVFEFSHRTIYGHP